MHCDALCIEIIVPRSDFPSVGVFVSACVSECKLLIGAVVVRSVPVDRRRSLGRTNSRDIAGRLMNISVFPHRRTTISTQGLLRSGDEEQQEEDKEEEDGRMRTRGERGRRGRLNLERMQEGQLNNNTARYCYKVVPSGGDGGGVGGGRVEHYWPCRGEGCSS